MSELQTPTPQSSPPTHPSQVSHAALRLLRNLQLKQWSPHAKALEDELTSHSLAEPDPNGPHKPNGWIRLTEKGRDWDTTTLRDEALRGKRPQFSLSNANYVLVVHIRQKGTPVVEAERLAVLGSGLVERHSEFGFVLTDYGREVELVDIEIDQPKEQPALGEPGFDAAVADQIDNLASATKNPSPQLMKVLRNEMEQLIGEGELTAERLHMICEFARVSADLLSVRNPLGPLKRRRRGGGQYYTPDESDYGGPMVLGSSNTFVGSPLAGAPSTETFGAQVTRQGIGALDRLIDTFAQNRAQPRIDELTKALRDTKQIGDQELADRIRKQIDNTLSTLSPASETAGTVGTTGTAGTTEAQTPQCKDVVGLSTAGTTEHASNQDVVGLRTDTSR